MIFYWKERACEWYFFRNLFEAGDKMECNEAGDTKHQMPNDEAKSRQGGERKRRYGGVFESKFVACWKWYWYDLEKQSLLILCTVTADRKNNRSWLFFRSAVIVSNCQEKENAFFPHPTSFSSSALTLCVALLFIIFRHIEETRSEDKKTEDRWALYVH